jgi:hypothetical protein
MGYMKLFKEKESKASSDQDYEGLIKLIDGTDDLTNQVL